MKKSKWSHKTTTPGSHPAFFKINKTLKMISINTNAATTEDMKIIDQVINIETQRKISRVRGAEHYGITTACVINGEFRIVSNYDVPADIAEKLENA